MRSVSPGSTSLAATSMDATTGARDPRELRSQERATAPQPSENVPCAGAWVLTCPCGWAASPPCTWTLELPLTALCRAATSAQKGQPGTGPRLRFPTGRTPSDLSAPSAPLPSAPPAGRGSSSRAPSTSRHCSEITITVTGRRLSFVHVANVEQCSVWKKRWWMKHVCSTPRSHILHVWQTLFNIVTERSSRLKNPSPCLSFDACWLIQDLKKRWKKTKVNSNQYSHADSILVQPDIVSSPLLWRILRFCFIFYYPTKFYMSWSHWRLNLQKRGFLKIKLHLHRSFNNAAWPFSNNFFYILAKWHDLPLFIYHAISKKQTQTLFICLFQKPWMKWQVTFCTYEKNGLLI